MTMHSESVKAFGLLLRFGGGRISLGAALLAIVLSIQVIGTHIHPVL
jgi:hypothetical protein